MRVTALDTRDQIKLAYTLGYGYATLDGQPEFVKQAWVGAALRAAGTAGRWVMNNKGKALVGAMIAPDVVDGAKQVGGLVAGKNGAMPNGQAKSYVATALRLAGNFAWLIPGVGWMAGLGMSIGGNMLANKLQQRANARLAAQQAQTVRIRPRVVRQPSYGQTGMFRGGAAPMQSWRPGVAAYR